MFALIKEIKDCSIGVLDAVLYSSALNDEEFAKQAKVL
jgi:hypothetical protein